MEFFLRNVLPVLNFSATLKKIEAIDKGRSIRLIPYPFQIYSIFFFALYKLTWDVASSFPFSLKGERKRFLFYNQSFFCNQSHKIHSIPFLKFSWDHLRSTLRITFGRGSFAVLFGDHLRYCTLLKPEVSEIPWLFPDLFLTIVKIPWPTELTISQIQWNLYYADTFVTSPSAA